MSCSDFQQTTPPCKTFQIIDPDPALLTSTSVGSFDPSLDESGSTILNIGDSRIYVPFLTTKSSDDYRFEYLYVDAIGIANPGDVIAVPVNKTIFGFTVDLAGSPTTTGYILRWRVVVQGIISSDTIDLPESLRLPLTQTRTFVATFVNPRSSANYGFTELRVENLIDSSDAQRAIIAQVIAKTQSNFTVGLNPPPDTANYYLVARTP